LASITVLLGEALNIATQEQTDPYFADVGGGISLNLLPPVYSLDGFSVTVQFGAQSDVPGEVWQVTAVTATPDSTFNYSTTATTVTITEKASPFSTTWYCLMSDYSYRTFNSDSEVLLASNPAYKALVSFDITAPYQIVKTHQFQVTIALTGTTTTEIVPITFTETIYLKTPQFVSRVQALVQAGQ